MRKLIIKGGKKLAGEIKISGAKNSAVALIPAALLCDENVILHNVPNISDVDALEEILLYLDAKVDRDNKDNISINSSEIKNKKIKSSLLYKNYYKN